MKLTREQAIAEHRKMWLWISQKIMEDAKHGIVRVIEGYKRIYKINVMKAREYIRSDCFCCHYSVVITRTGCDSCPLYWNNRKTEERCYRQRGYYCILHNKLDNMLNNGLCYKDAKKCATLAYKIAMLPVKEK